MNRHERSLIVVAAFVFVILTASGLVLYDSPASVMGEERQVFKLFFATSDGQYLVPELRVMEKETTPHQIVEELISGPLPGSQLISTVPSGTRVKSVDVQDGVAYVDLSAEFAQHSGGTAGEIMTVYSVVNTLCNLPRIYSVQLMVDGDPIETLSQHLYLGQPLREDTTLVLPPPTVEDTSSNVEQN